ncbi:uncharacterized protein LOC144451358 [Glandiceps talaboti]
MPTAKHLQLSEFLDVVLHTLGEIEKNLETALEHLPQQNQDVVDIQQILQTTKAKVKDVTFLTTEFVLAEQNTINTADLQLPWERLGSGAFGDVYKVKLKGATVAVKVEKLEEESDERRQKYAAEGRLLRHLSHDNIVAYRGMGVIDRDIETYSIYCGTRFIVMEYIDDNLARYVERQKTAERQGLSATLTWNLSRQIGFALNYLHSQQDPIAHRDLKPDNILVDIASLNMRVKLADFGLACHSYQLDEREKSKDDRWVAPELRDDLSDEEDDDDDEEGEGEEEEEAEVSEEEEGDSEEQEKSAITPKKTIEDYKNADVYSYGQVVAFMLTGCKPWKSVLTADFEDVGVGSDPHRGEIPLSANFIGQLPELVTSCRHGDPCCRPNFDTIVSQYFQDDKNPYESEALKAEFFSCGFLTGTKIFVADSLVTEFTEGYYNNRRRPQGYDSSCLDRCLVMVKDKPYHIKCEDWEADLEETYYENFQKFRSKARRKIIDDNPIGALKRLSTERRGAEETQVIELQFAETTYCHHRAMREIWRSFEEPVQRDIIPCKSDVHPAYSTSFGVQIAILTNEGPGRPQKFVFTKRSKREGMASPGTYTCGAVESTSVKDYTDDDGQTFISLVNTAARGLHEELFVELNGDDRQAITLSTVYLKFDNHEWGICGFVDLADDRIDPERQLSFDQIQSRFTLGPKDKYEHEEIVGVDFEVNPMVDFIRENYQNFASSTKLVVVKVMQSFFGVSRVEHAFKSKTPHSQ